VLAAAASPTLTRLPPELFLFAFAGSIAAALGDTLSSEIGGVFDNPRLITTLERVEPGTDGAVTWEGEVAGLTGTVLIAAIAVSAFETVGALGAGVVVFGGVAGMTVDSLLGATVEGVALENEGVNFPPVLLVATGATAEHAHPVTPVGYALAVTDGDDATGYLAELAVEPGSQGEGHGSALLETLVERLRGSGVERLRVTVRVVDERARSFYRDHGFERTERLPDRYESGDGLLLERDVAP